MILFVSMVISILFGAGIFLMLKRDLIRLAVGVNLVSNSIFLLLISSSLTRGRAPIHPVSADAVVSDPLVQALALTAIVISFAIQTLVLTLVYAVYVSHRSLDEEALREAEEQEVTQLQREGDPQR